VLELQEAGNSRPVGGVVSENQDLHDRITRAASWIEAAEELRKYERHRHAEFIALYVAFNSLFGRRQYEEGPTELNEDLSLFLTKVIAMRTADEAAGASTLSRALLACREPCLKLLAMPFHHNDYWRPRADLSRVREKCHKECTWARTVLGQARYEDFLRPVLRRLAVLRNQIVHGCVTYGRSSKGLEGLLTGLTILRSVVPALHHLAKTRAATLTDSELRWEPLPYPRLESRRHPHVGAAR